MIHRLYKVANGIYRGSAPSIKDLSFLKDVLKINKIISLDRDAGSRIHRATQLLGIKHIMLPIEMDSRASLLNFLNNNIQSLLEDDGPTFIHCAQGKDRTGLAVALYRCRVQGWSATKAIKEAKSHGFGIGVDPKVVRLYEKLIHKACGEDTNSAYDIVSNQREYPSDYNDYTLDGWSQQSWSPYADYRVREFPYANTEIDWPEQYQSRLDYGLDDSAFVSKNIDIPQTGTYDTSTSGIMGAGPSLVGTGYV